MKNIQLLFFLATIAILFQSCTDDDVSKASLVGNWTVDEALVRGLKVNGTSLAVYLRFEAGYSVQEGLNTMNSYENSIESIFLGKKIELSADSTYISGLHVFDGSGIWTINSNNTILTFDSATENEKEFKINAMTSDMLEISSQEEQFIDFNSDGVDEAMIVPFTLTLSK